MPSLFKVDNTSMRFRTQHVLCYLTHTGKRFYFYFIFFLLYMSITLQIRLYNCIADFFIKRLTLITKTKYKIIVPLADKLVNYYGYICLISEKGMSGCVIGRKWQVEYWGDNSNMILLVFLITDIITIFIDGYFVVFY